jgi:Immunoglobulin-like domain of bacterial spore germination
MKKHLLLCLAIVSLFCLASCQTNDYGKKDGKTTMEDKEKTPSKEEEKTPAKETILFKNDAFKVTSIVNEEAMKNVIIVEGKARVFEASFLYRLEDGHNVLAEGHTMADQGAPGWGNFKIKISHNHPSSPNGVLTLYVASAKDGNPEHELHIPVQFSNYE